MFAQFKQPTPLSGDTVMIDMVALDQPFMYNRLGTAQPTGMIFALKSDIVPKPGKKLSAGNVQLISTKRPRPIVLRANVGDIMIIKFTNYLRKYVPKEKVAFYPPYKTSQLEVNPLYPATREAGVHIVGTELVKTINDDASNVGSNQNSLVPPNGSITYHLLAAAEGTFVLHSTADNIADGTIRAGQISNGLFGSLVVEPPGAEWYRSQVTEDDLFDATLNWIQPDGDGNATVTNKTSTSVEFRQLNKGWPVIDYNAERNGVPILKMYKQKKKHVRELIATDLTALITGPGAGDFTSESPSFLPVTASPDRRQPYREFSIHYHEAPYAVQAFPDFYIKNTTDPLNDLTQVIQGGVDQFAFNYGTGGIGAEIYANRVGVGPMADCVDCAYEEFFLSAWAIGDPAQVVDVPANVSLDPTHNKQKVLQELMIKEAVLLGGGPIPTRKTKKSLPQANEVLFPDDPSNVYHSYMNDHVKFRINHCGAGITHVHHQHAHQWLHSPNSDDGHYLDSQTINPGASYTLEIVYGGSGNLNKTVGDQIFHCHFYPHFAQGMWAMWRVHDVLETGTVYNGKDIDVNSRALPDGEIKRGTPIPGLVPIANQAMAPIPGKITIVDGQAVLENEGVSPGFPFYIPGIAGQRPPHPPKDFAIGTITKSESGEVVENTYLNGGLPRSVTAKGETLFENHTIYDWTKISGNVEVVELPEEGTYYEILAMDAHATRNHFNPTPRGGLQDTFFLNGRPPVSGAPYADPAVDAEGDSIGIKRVYKAANIQVDAVLNELGWHYPQQRPIVLWGDVASTISGDKPPEPFFFRANSEEFVEYWHTNLVPEYYELDDYQVRTPTDIIGQHIHLVKFDVTSSDGAANGYNYEDGTFSPQMVVEQINKANEGKYYKPDLASPFSGSILEKIVGLTPDTTKLEPYLPMDIWGDAPPGQSWLGAQTTIQRWYANPLGGTGGHDRTLRTVFTHDHFGPSTHQQIGLYAGLLIEPAGSKWTSSSTGEKLGFAQLGTTREVKVGGVTMDVEDGGPTDWQAIIHTTPESGTAPYREFMFEFQDNQQAYLAGSMGSITPYPDFEPTSTTDSAELKTYVDSFTVVVNTKYTGWRQDSMAITPPGHPELVTTGNRGTLSLNYRNSPLPIRVSPGTNADATNLAYAFSSRVTRNISVMNKQPTPGARIDASANDFAWPKQPLSPGMEDGDPYTPLARAYAGDQIQIRTLVGAHVNPHFFNIHGVKWYFEPSLTNSGYRSTQMMSLSEHFEMNFKLPHAKGNEKGITDYLYITNADDNGLQAGTFGLMRSYDSKQPGLAEMPNNKPRKVADRSGESTGCGCPTGAKTVDFDVTAISIDKYQIGGPNWGFLTYNKQHRNFDSKAIIFVNTSEVEDFKTNYSYEPKPLVLRVNAGDCINMKVRNEITPNFVNNTGGITYASSTDPKFPNTYSYETSFSVGMHAELLNYDVSTSDGTSVGQNKLSGQILEQGKGIKEVNYTWYAGQWTPDGDNFRPEAVELGTCVLTGPDPLMQYVSGLFGALIVEPEGSHWVENQNDPTSANVYESLEAFNNKEQPLFREFVLMFHDNINVPAEPVGSIIGVPVTGGLNYKSEPLANRVFFDAQGTINFNSINVSDIVSNQIVLAAPETPTFVAKANIPARFRVMYAGGKGDGTTFDLHGHAWQEEPYTDDSRKLGFNPESQWMGARGQLGALNSFDLLINSAGGQFGVTGDYLYRDYRNQTFQDGIWGIFKVTDGADAPMITRIDIKKKNTTFTGVNTVDPTTGKYAETVTISVKRRVLGTVDVNQFNGEWELPDVVGYVPRGGLTVVSNYTNRAKGGSVTYKLKEVIQLTEKPRERKQMKKAKRSPIKTIEPGSNRAGVLDIQHSRARKK